MKSLFFVCLFSVSTLFANTITLQPGSTVTVKASTDTTITCAGSNLASKEACRCVQATKYWLPENEGQWVAGYYSQATNFHYLSPFFTNYSDCLNAITQNPICFK